MKTVLCIPAGRRRYLEILRHYLLRERHTFDEGMLWLHCWEDASDEEYVRWLADDLEFTLIEPKHELEERGQFCFKQYDAFYVECTDSSAIYIKMDDDIVWMEQGAIERLIEHRTSNPDYLMSIGNTVNNCVCNVLHPINPMGGCSMSSSDPIGHFSPEFAYRVHDLFLTRLSEGLPTSEYHIPDYIPEDFMRAPNHVYAWWGRDFPDGVRPGNDEQFLTTDYARGLNRPVCYCGDALFVHYAYTPQRESLDKTDILERYEALTHDTRQDSTDSTALSLAD